MSKEPNISAIKAEGDTKLSLEQPWSTIVAWLGGCLALIPILFASEIHLSLGLQIFTEQGMALALGLGVAIVFIKSPLKPDQTKVTVPFYDAICALIGLCAGIYLAVRFPILQDELFERRPEASRHWNCFRSFNRRSYSAYQLGGALPASS